ncbi:hypothetical protein GCM10027284_08760 [Cyclobacterium sediminis]
MDDLIIDSLNILALVVNSIFIYKAFISERKRKFEDTLFEKKLSTYQSIIDRVYDISKKLDYSSYPFDAIHKIKTEEEWQEFHGKNIGPLLHLGMNLHLSLQKDYGLLLPEKILNILNDFSLYATRMVIEAYYFDGSLILEKEKLMHNKLFELLDAMRMDLGVDQIDKSLQRRLREKQI